MHSLMMEASAPVTVYLVFANGVDLLDQPRSSGIIYTVRKTRAYVYLKCFRDANKSNAQELFN